jgi:hypothetical protein
MWFSLQRIILLCTMLIKQSIPMCFSLLLTHLSSQGLLMQLLHSKRLLICYSWHTTCKLFFLSLSYCDALVMYILNYDSSVLAEVGLICSSQNIMNYRLLKISTFTNISVSVSMWHLLVFYQNHKIKKHLEEILFYI